MSTEDYTDWMGQEVKKLIDLLTTRTLQNNPDALNNQIAEVQRGIEYGTTNPGSVDELLLKIGRQVVDSLRIYIRQMRKPDTGIPPGGQATILTGGVSYEPTQDNSAPKQDKFSVDELKGALASRKKDKVEKKLKGSLDLLREYEES
jgi:hypothetical protein